MESMMTGIEQAKANIIQMQANADKLRNDIKFENRKFIIQILALVVGAFAAGAAWMHYYHP
jgi:uncharacterized membrane protein YoaK (UPF0700 family)